MQNKTYLSISARFSYKDLPKGYLGLKSENIKWNVKLSMSEILKSITLEIMRWHSVLIERDEAIDEIEKFIVWLKDTKEKINAQSSK